MLRMTSIAVVAVAAVSLGGAAIARDARPAPIQVSTASPFLEAGGWSARCPSAGVTVTAEEIGTGRPLFVRTYRGASSQHGGTCLVEDNGRLRAVLYQMFVDGSDIASQLRPQLDSFFPARPGARFSSSGYARVDGGQPSQQQFYRHDITYAGKSTLEISGRSIVVNEVSVREVAAAHNYAATSRYFFDDRSGALVRFEYQHERGGSRNLPSWQINGEIR